MKDPTATQLIPALVEIGWTLARSSEWYHRFFVVILAKQLWEWDSRVAEDAEVEPAAPRPKCDVGLLLDYQLSAISQRTDLRPTQEQRELVEALRRYVRRAETIYREVASCGEPLASLAERVAWNRSFRDEFEVRAALLKRFTPIVVELTARIDRALQQLARPNALLVSLGTALACIESPSDLVTRMVCQQVAQSREVTFLGTIDTIRRRGGLRDFRRWNSAKRARDARARFVVDVLNELRMAGFPDELVDRLLERFNLLSLLDRDKWSDLELTVAPFIAELKRYPLTLPINSSSGESERPEFDGSHLSFAGERMAIPSRLRIFTSVLVKRYPEVASYADLVEAEDQPGGDDKGPNHNLVQKRKSQLAARLAKEPLHTRLSIGLESGEGYRLIVNPSTPRDADSTQAKEPSSEPRCEADLLSEDVKSAVESS